MAGQSVEHAPMEGDHEERKPVFIRGTIEVQPGKPIQTKDRVELAERIQSSPLGNAMANTLRAYRKAARDLLEGQYASVRDLAPPHMRVPCHIWVLCCRDGVVVRYDAAGDEEPKVRNADLPESLADVIPNFSEHVIHMPDDPATYVPKHAGPGLIQMVVNAEGEAFEHSRIHPAIFAPRALPPNFKMPLPPTRPPCLVSINPELQMELHGVVLPADAPAKAVPTNPERFVAHGVVRLPVGWELIEIYPRLGEEYWRPAYAAMWAQLDLLSVIAQHNAVKSALHRLDGRRVAREHYAGLLEQFEALLAGPEEPCHQFLKKHPEFLCATYDRVWSKVPFGNHVSDFVFREPSNDYLLVEIEAPHRELFRKDGHPLHPLNHAINQITDWIQHIQDNKAAVEKDFPGISATPRMLVVIGRSASLTEKNWRSLTLLQGQRPRLSILTYDDVIAHARENLERHFGPLSLKTQNLELYFYRGDPG